MNLINISRSLVEFLIRFAADLVGPTMLTIFRVGSAA